MFAGPNGSGKTVLFDHLRSNKYINTEIYVSADRIENDLKIKGKFFFSSYRVKVSEEEFKDHIRMSGLFQKTQDHSFIDRIHLKSGILTFHGDKKKVNSYIASFIATYLCEKILKTKQSFCFETVLSHPSKIKLLEKAKNEGYKTYLYFICTDNWKLNVERVKLRVKDGGHNVDHKKIETRYYRSLKNFSQAASQAQSTYLIDNSKAFSIIAELKNKKVTHLVSPFPVWLQEYFNPSDF
jgi:predicted ABC-type ATPase